jgi:hypothetical protein
MFIFWDFENFFYLDRNTAFPFKLITHISKFTVSDYNSIIFYSNYLPNKIFKTSLFGSAEKTRGRPCGGETVPSCGGEYIEIFCSSLLLSDSSVSSLN